MKKIVGKMLILTIALLCTPITVMAQENTVRVDAEEVLPDGKWQDYNLGVNMCIALLCWKVTEDWM